MVVTTKLSKAGLDRTSHVAVKARLIGAHTIDGVAPAGPADADQAPACGVDGTVIDLEGEA